MPPCPLWQIDGRSPDRERRTADFDIAAAYEALARAHSVAGDASVAADWKAKAVLALDADADDRELIEGDIATLPIPNER